MKFSDDLIDSPFAPRWGFSTKLVHSDDLRTYLCIAGRLAPAAIALLEWVNRTSKIKHDAYLAYLAYPKAYYKP